MSNKSKQQTTSTDCHKFDLRDRNVPRTNAPPKRANRLSSSDKPLTVAEKANSWQDRNDNRTGRANSCDDRGAHQRRKRGRSSRSEDTGRKVAEQRSRPSV